MRALFRRLHSNLAQSMVEFALIVPILFLLILGIIEMGYTLFVYTSVQNAAREGARAGAVRPCISDTTPIKDATVARLPALVDTTTARNNTSIAYSTGSSLTADYGSIVTVTVNYSFDLLDPLTTSLIPHVNVNGVASRSITVGCGALTSVAPTPVPTPVITPGATSTPTDTPDVCEVPDMVFSSVSAAKQAWRDAGFNSGNISTVGTGGGWTVAFQSLTAHVITGCDSSITIYEAAPTSTPTETSTPTITNTPTETPTASATSTPSNTPTIAICMVPSMVGKKVNSASSSWSSAGFTGSFNQVGGNGNWDVGSQSLSAGALVACSSSVTVYEVLATNTPTSLPTNTPTNIPTNTAVPPTNTQVPPTATPVKPTATNTAVPSATPITPTATASATATPTVTNTPTASATVTNTPTASATATVTSTPTASATASVTSTPTTSAVPTATGLPTSTPTLIPCAVLPAPSLSGSKSGVNITLTWSAVTGATKYRVHRVVGSTNSSIDNVSSPYSESINSYSNNTIISYYVSAVDSCGQEGIGSNTYSVVR